MDLIAVMAVCAALVCAFLPRVPIVWAAAAGGGVSIFVTAAHPLLGETRAGAPAMVAEALVLLILTLLATRLAPGRTAVVAAGLPGLAVGLILLRVLWPGEASLSMMAGAAWGMTAVAAVAVGVYLRTLDHRRRRAVSRAKRAQRLLLARDLHDFVAHDVSGILVQAQAAQTVPGPVPPQVAEALRRIEAAGLRALAALDRTVLMLHEEGAGGAPGVEALARLADEFSPSAAVDLRVEPELELSPATSAAVYRMVSEALTNVRRHGVGVSVVEVVVAREGDTVRVRVTDDGTRHDHSDGQGDGGDREDGDGGKAAVRGGFGLAGLAEQAERLGGTLTAEPGRPKGWRVEMVLPR